MRRFEPGSLDAEAEKNPHAGAGATTLLLYFRRPLSTGTMRVCHVAGMIGKGGVLSKQEHAAFEVA